MPHIIWVIKKLSILKTIYFNFHYLPFKQAIRFPIYIHRRTKLKKMKGGIVIATPISRGMINIGCHIYGFLNNNDITIWEHNGGNITFNGSIEIGAGSFICVSSKGKLTLGGNLLLGCVRLICYCNVFINDNTRISWGTTLVDTDFHATINIVTGNRNVPLKPIYIGKNNWIGFDSVILKGTKTPDFCVVGAKSTLNKEYDLKPYCTLAGSPAKKVAENFYRDLDSYV